MSPNYILLFVFVNFVNGISRPTNIVLENNEYKHILVGIHSSVPEDKNLIADIKKMFEDGSAVLHEATYKRAYFKEVTIMVPESWPDNPDYSKATSETYRNSDVVFTSPNPRSRRGLPQTRSFSGCGSPGIRIYFTPDVFNHTMSTINGIDTLGTGPRGLLLIHEWGRFRWGVFEEYAHDGEKQFYFSPTTGKLEGVRCNINQRGMNLYYTNDGSKIYCRLNKTDPTRRYDDRCRFLLYPSQSTKSSIMSSPRPGANHFCDDDTTDPKKVHNYEAPNRQNRLCGQRSTWSVILETPDFKNNNNPPRDVTDTKPTFKIVKAAKTSRVAVVFDVNDKNYAHELKRVGEDYIHNSIKLDTHVGILAISNTSHVLHPMARISSSSDKRRLKRSLHHSVFTADRETDSLQDELSGHTDVLNGLQKAIQWLDAGSELTLFSDRRRFSEDVLKRLSEDLESHKIIFTVVALNHHHDDKLASISFKSGGRYYYGTNKHGSTSVNDALFQMRQQSSDDHQVPLQVLSKLVEFPTDNLTGEFFMDEDIGRNTVFTIMYSKIEPSITIVSPTGRLFNSRYPEYKADHLFNTVRIEIPEIAEHGVWKYNITCNGNVTEKLSLMVTSHPATRDIQPVIVDSGIATGANNKHHMIWAEVIKGSLPVSGVKVSAIVDRPDSLPVRLELWDNGGGADITKEDGVYCRHFTQFSGYGRYSVKIEVTYNLQDISNKLVKNGDSEKKAQLDTVINRCTHAGSFLYTNPKNKHGGHSPSEVTDDLRPVRVTDLTVQRTSRQDQLVVLSWTAPGEDLDFGKAFQYKIFVAKTIHDMLQKNSVKLILQDLMTPKEAGHLEVFSIRVPFSPDTKWTAVYGVKAVDRNGNEGEMSNLVITGFVSDPTPTPSSTEYCYLGVTIGTVSAVFVLLSLIMVFCRHSKRHLDKKYNLV